MADDLSSDSSSSSDSILSFDSSPRHSFDGYSNMRLDVDSMTYEELLALGDTIGHVCTGLTEDMISKSLIVKEYCLSDQNQRASCVICLDEYKNKEETGTLKKCGHEYHASCIREWLKMKNLCPMCKCAALVDPPEA